MSESPSKPRNPSSTIEQIRAQAPPQAVGYRVEVHGQDGRVTTWPRRQKTAVKDSPQALTYYKLHPYQAPAGMPEGRHLLRYIGGDGLQIADGILSYYPLAGSVDAAPAAAPSAASSDFQRELSQMRDLELKMRARAQALEMSDATTKNQAGLLANNQQLSQDLADAYRNVLENAVAIANKATEAASKLLEGHRALMEGAALHAKMIAESVPTPPPPPQDWASVAKEGIRTLGEVAETYGIVRKKDREIASSSDAIEVKERLPAASESATADKAPAKPEESPSDDDDEPPSAAAPSVSAPPAKPVQTKPKESRQDTAKRALRRVLQALASVQSGDALRFLHEPNRLRAFLVHLRLLMFPVTAERWRVRWAQ